MFIPKPIDTKDIKIPDELNDVLEIIAENVHNVWAQERIADGWIYGAVRSTEKKTTPCLVPYNELPEYEKDYDRKTALETIKIIIKLGYKISNH